ncbi:hypothetical protein C0995_005534 [Termitomyces sp. Mi166|nr:hypothetical protein C0995_005534 [Termitomyces sp. Mi166\
MPDREHSIPSSESIPPQAQLLDPSPQNNHVALAGMMTMFRVLAALANQTPGLPSSLVTTSLLLDVACHEFHPMDLCKLDPTSKFRRADMERTESNGSRVTGVEDYSALHTLLIPLSTYFSVLQAFSASSGDAHTTFVIGHGAVRYISHCMRQNPEFWSPEGGIRFFN